MIHVPSLMPILIVAFLFIILFGANRLPEAARALGRSSSEFKKGLTESHDPEPAPPAPALKD